MRVAAQVGGLGRRLYRREARGGARAANARRGNGPPVESGDRSIDVTQDPESLAFIKGLGYQQAPVVVAGEDHWSGFRPDRIKAVAAAAAPLALQA